MSEGTFNPARRRLCPDGACIGVIGDDGRCRACGRAGSDSAAGSGPPPVTGRDADSDTDESFGETGGAAFSADDSAEEVRHAGGELDGPGPGAFRPDRRLCDDGSCVGVIGAGEVCSVCGRPAGG